MVKHGICNGGDINRWLRIMKNPYLPKSSLTKMTLTKNAPQKMRVCHKPHPIRPVRAKALYIAQYFKAFALTGRQVCIRNYPGRCSGLGASALSGRIG